MEASLSISLSNNTTNDSESLFRMTNHFMLNYFNHYINVWMHNLPYKVWCL
jgi:hypothetical protein